MGVVGICGVDTRSITRKIRSLGAVKCVISNEELTEKEFKGYLTKGKLKDDWMKEVSTKKIYNIPGSGCKVALIDFGVKKNIINNLIKRDCDITVFPYDASYKGITNIRPSGVFLSNGPGDPKAVPEAAEVVKRIINKVPIFGICLGHQILSLALGGDTYKMKYGHRGSNHGVLDIEKDKVYITSQNHGYVVYINSMERAGAVITHLNLSDNRLRPHSHRPGSRV